jgi:hypothetical protein
MTPTPYPPYELPVVLDDVRHACAARFTHQPPIVYSLLYSPKETCSCRW